MVTFDRRSNQSGKGGVLSLGVPLGQLAVLGVLDVKNQLRWGSWAESSEVGVRNFGCFDCDDRMTGRVELARVVTPQRHGDLILVLVDEDYLPLGEFLQQEQFSS